MPLALSPLDRLVCFGELDASDARGVRESLLEGDAGGPEEDPGGSRSFDLPLPNPPNDVPKFEDDFLSGDKARPYGCTLCRRRPSTVPNRLRL